MIVHGVQASTFIIERMYVKVAQVKGGVSVVSAFLLEFSRSLFGHRCLLKEGKSVGFFG